MEIKMETIFTIILMIITATILLGIWEMFELGNIKLWREQLFHDSETYKFIIIVSTFVGLVIVYYVFKDFFENNSIIANGVIILLPLVFFYKIYEYGVKNEGYSELNSLYYVTNLVGYLIFGPLSLLYWISLIIDLF
jgi:hypothetical protein